MICSISGTAAEDPVVSPKSGHVFERRLIEKYIDTHGKDPVNDEPLSTGDLIQIKTGAKNTLNVKPRPVTATSIPSMLQLFQNEWDALMLETYTLKEHLDKVRQELSHALYQHDAACRVIARLIKDRDQARSALANASVHLPTSRSNGANNNNNEMEGVEPTAQGIDDGTKERLTSFSKEISKERKKRQVSPDLAAPEAVAEYKPIASNPVHKASTPGIACMDIHRRQDGLIVTGGADSNIAVFDKNTSKIIDTLPGHAKKVNSVQFAHSADQVLFVSASQDRTARVWRGALEANSIHSTHVVRIHDDDVVDVSVHPTGDYFATASADQSWAFHDMHSGTTLKRVEGAGSALASVEFHPDGLILAAGTADNTVRVWDIKSQANVATFEGHTGPVVDIAFSENGFYLATASLDGVKLWDLRKLKNFLTIPAAHENTGVSCVAWDYSGMYLAMGSGNELRIVHGKSFDHLATYTDHTAPVTGVKFGRDASWFASTSIDRMLKIWAPQ